MFKKIIILLFFSLSLTSCGDSTDKVVESGETVQSIFENIEFSISIPSTWEVIKNTSEILPQPSNWDIVFDAVSTTISDDFYRNILVLKQESTDTLSSLDFIIWNYIGSKKEYFYIKDLAEKNVLINDVKTKIYSFEAKYSEDTPILKFLQTWIICDKTWFLITIALEKSNLNMERYEWLLGTFKCKVLTESIPIGEK